jgi:hypothetical protein
MHPFTSKLQSQFKNFSSLFLSWDKWNKLYFIAKRKNKATETQQRAQARELSWVHMMELQNLEVGKPPKA